MTLLRTLLAAATLALSLASCDSGVYIDDDSGMHHLFLRNGSLVAQAQGQPEAVITPAGDLSIGQKPVVVTQAQRDLLMKYFGEVQAIRSAGIETGKAGAAMAGHAINDVAAGLAHGDPDSIGPKIDARAKQIEAKAQAICTSIASLQATQNAIASTLQQFKPYVTVDAGKDSDCRSKVKAS
jgi:hypothetical protein